MEMNFQDNTAPYPSPDGEDTTLSNQRLVSSRVIVSVNPFDILCGRGKTAFTHPGNRKFRDTVASVIDEYNAAGSRLGKSMVVNRIVQGIRAEGGRFLKLDRSSHRYYELDDKQTKEKVGHAIRDASSLINSRKEKKERMHKAVSSKLGTSSAHSKAGSSSCGDEDEDDMKPPVRGHQSEMGLVRGQAAGRGQSTTTIPAVAVPSRGAGTGAVSRPTNPTQDDDDDPFLDHINEVLGPVTHHDTTTAWGDIGRDGTTR